MPNEIIEETNNSEIVSEPTSVAIAMPERKINPAEVLEKAHIGAKLLKSVVDNSDVSLKVNINKGTYLKFEAWQTIGQFNGASVRVCWTKRIPEEGELEGYVAKAEVYRLGEVIASAEASVSRDEKNWKDKDEFQLRSMAQTRAGAKALRMAFSWVVVLAGYNPTPAEEIIGTSVEEEIKAVEDIEFPGETCPECKIGSMVKKTGKYGDFMACDAYPKCKYIDKKK